MSTVQTIPEVIERLLAGRTYVTSTEVASAAGVSRQAAHRWLTQMAAKGLLVHEGARRSSRYRLTPQRAATYSIDGLTSTRSGGQSALPCDSSHPDVEDTPKLLSILIFTFTEMVNNAIDHSRGSQLRVRWFLLGDRLAFEVEDDGVGALSRSRESRDLDDDFEAVGELSKGKQTTDPARHSGLGIFLTSRTGRPFGPRPTASPGRSTTGSMTLRWDGWIGRGTARSCVAKFVTTPPGPSTKS